MEHDNHTSSGTRKKQSTKKHGFSVIRASWSGVKGVISAQIPPEFWEVNQIRSQRIQDTQLATGPKAEPHITLSDPFVDYTHFEELSGWLLSALESVEPFTLTLDQFGYFTHRSTGRYTLWVGPQDSSGLCRVHQAVDSVFQSHPSKTLRLSAMYRVSSNRSSTPRQFAYHMSLGKFNSKKEVEARMEWYKSNWKPISFRLQEVHVLSKEHPDKKYSDVYIVRKTIPLGSGNALRSTPTFVPVPFPFTKKAREAIRRTAWIRDVPEHVTKEELLQKLMERDLGVEETNITLDNDGKSRGYGIVVFSCEEKRRVVLEGGHLDVGIEGGPIRFYECM